MSFLDTLSSQRCPKSAYKHELFLFIICIIICTCLQISSYIGNHCLCLYVNKWTVSVLFSNQIASSTIGSEKPLSVQLLFSTHMKKPQWRYLQRMASVYVNSWQIWGGGHSCSAVAKNGTWWKYYGHLISFPPPKEHRKHGGVFLKSTRTKKKNPSCAELDDKSLLQHASHP